MTSKLITLTTLVGLAAASHGATLTLVNSDFSLGSNGSGGTGADIFGWDEGNSAAGLERFYINDTVGLPTYGLSANFQAREGSYIAQSFSNTEAQTGDFSSYTVSFDIGWRSNTAAPNDLALEFQLWDYTNDVAIGTAQTYTLPADSPSNAFDSFRLIESGASLVLTDTSASAGNDIGLRITARTSQDNFNPTGWLDNVSVEATAVPEPSSTALFGLAGLGLILRRRR